MRLGIPLDEGPPLRAVAYRVILDPAGRVFLDGEEVSTAVRAPEVSRGRLRSGRPPGTPRGPRRPLAQRRRRGGVVEGRDIGTVVFPTPR